MNKGDGMESSEIDIKQAVQSLRDELIAAAAAGTGQDLAFEIGPIELEFAIELRRDARVKTGVKAWVVSADADAGMSKARTHRVKISLTPRAAHGGPLMIAADGDRHSPRP